MGEGNDKYSNVVKKLDITDILTPNYGSVLLIF